MQTPAHCTINCGHDLFKISSINDDDDEFVINFFIVAAVAYKHVGQIDQTNFISLVN